MKNLKLVIFDLDGTLVDAYAAITKSFNSTMQKLGYPKKNPHLIRRAVGLGDENLLRPFVKPKDLQNALFVYRRYHKIDLPRKSRLLPGAKTILAYLKNQGYKMAVASNRPTKFSWILIRCLGLTRFFDYILCADKLKYGKPHPEILNKIMRKIGVDPKQTLYVGDMVIDAQAGRRAGVATVIVTTGSSLKSDIEKERPLRVFPKINMLREIL